MPLQPQEKTRLEYNFHTRAIQHISNTLLKISNARYVWVLLFGLGLIRNIALLFAYPPAHGSDSFVYYLYMERFRGYDLPLIGQTAPPLYPIVLYISIYGLRSIYWLLGAQFIASAALAPLFYTMLRKYNPFLALGAALIILVDVQVAVSFNFISTEPLYVTLLTLTLGIFLHATDAPVGTRRILMTAFVVGVLLGLLLLTRSVARYFIVAFVIVMLLRTRDLKRTLALIAGFGFTMALWMSFSVIAWGRIEGTSTSNHLKLKVIVEKNEWVSSENGPYSAQFLALRENCPATRADRMRYCLFEELGDWNKTAELINGVYTETISAHRWEYLQEVTVYTEDFLSLSAQQYGFDKEVPSDVQCRNIDEAVQNTTVEWLQSMWWTWILPNHPNYSEETVNDMQDAQRRTLSYMCPPLRSSSQLKTVTDTIAARYRSLGRPHPFNWYFAALAFVVVIPWARRYMTIVLILGSVVAMHALVSAIIFNIQPRYVMVINPLRATLLLFVVYVVGILVVHALDEILFRISKPHISDA